MSTKVCYLLSLDDSFGFLSSPWSLRRYFSHLKLCATVVLQANRKRHFTRTMRCSAMPCAKVTLGTALAPSS